MKPRALTPLMEAIWRAQGKCCGVCGIPMVPFSLNHPQWGWTIEHVWPRSRYRYDGEGNRFISHAACNNAKADRDPTPGELLILARVNEALGHALTIWPTSYVDRTTGPTAFELAFIRARTA